MPLYRYAYIHTRYIFGDNMFERRLGVSQLLILNVPPAVFCSGSFSPDISALIGGTGAVVEYLGKIDQVWHTLYCLSRGGHCKYVVCGRRLRHVYWHSCAAVSSIAPGDLGSGIRSVCNRRCCSIIASSPCARHIRSPQYCCSACAFRRFDGKTGIDSVVHISTLSFAGSRMDASREVCTFRRPFFGPIMGSLILC